MTARLTPAKMSKTQIARMLKEFRGRGVSDDPMLAFIESIPIDQLTTVGCVYFFLAKEVNRVKIGHTTNPIQRLSSLQTGSPVKLEFLTAFIGTMREETAFHQRYKDQHHTGEWFEYSGLLVEHLDQLMSGEEEFDASSISWYGEAV